MNSLTIDPEFRNLIYPLTADELAGLKEDISTYGCREPITVLKGEGIILDGHHRYEICQERGITFQVVELDFPNRTEAKIWMIKNQRGRRNLNESQRAMLAVTLEALYSEQAKERQGTRTDLGQPLDEGETGRSAEKAAKDMGISHQTVSLAKKIKTSGIPELAQMVETNKMAVRAAAMVAELPEEQQKVVQDKIAKKAEKKEEEGKISSRVTSSEVEQIIRGLTSHEDKVKTPEENLVKVEQHLKSITKILNGVEITTQREKLSDLLGLCEQIIHRVKAIGLKSPVSKHEVETVPSDYQLEINAQYLNFFVKSGENSCMVSSIQETGWTLV
jgi:ParB-like chromosome segregation protein Spo0J